MLPKPWSPDHALRNVEALYAIRNANGMIALLFQTLIELKRKGRANRHRARPVEYRTGVSGVELPIYGKNSFGST